MSIEVIEAKMEAYDELIKAMEMLDALIETEVILAELKYHDNPEELSKVKEMIFKRSSKELDKLNEMFGEIKGV